MQNPLFPNNNQEQQAILNSIGVKSFDELICDLPKSKVYPELKIADGLSEKQISTELSNIISKNKTIIPRRSFLGGGVYYRYVPSIVDYISGRSEFYTAYTPYQPEMSQGTLIAIFEFQTYMAELTGMEISNASLYDGATALAESIIMSSRISSKESKTFLIIGAIPPQYKKVLDSYNQGLNFTIKYIEDDDNIELDDSLSSIVLFYPNYFGQVMDYEKIISKAKQKGIGIIMGVINPLALGIFKTPGEFGADIVFGEAISLGSYPSFGGPALGFITTRKDFIRHIPGRIVGETNDKDGKIGYVLTFQTREQHIRRERATSNICSNQGLMALRTTLYLSSLGKEGFEELAYDIYEKTRLLKKSLATIKEFVIDKNISFQDVLVSSESISFDELNQFLSEQNIHGGIVLSHQDAYLDQLYLISVNDFTTTEDINDLVVAMKEFISEK
ncbi:MAG: hypothetical protein A2Y40_05500 [Candidatus Margulisbacteria bacterium GWF2_35_9]|nr:MAG: hypothetical protein A2Y40_05500 [Candidatus Margulisbacteria bacterium GWF2_35_9]